MAASRLQPHPDYILGFLLPSATFYAACLPQKKLFYLMPAVCQTPFAKQRINKQSDDLRFMVYAKIPMGQFKANCIQKKSLRVFAQRRR